MKPGKRPAGRGWWKAGGGVLLVLAVAGGWLQFRVVEREWVEDRAIAPPERERKTWLMQEGWTVILREGAPGLERVRLRERRRGRKSLGQEVVSSELLKEPRREVRLVGASRQANAINAYRLTRAVKSYRMLATGYGPGPEENSWEYAGITKLGWRTRRGIVAVDPKVIPLRSLLYIEGYGLAWAGDVGGAIKGDRIDLCFNKTQEALKWGKRHAYVYVLRGVKAEK